MGRRALTGRYFSAPPTFARARSFDPPAAPKGPKSPAEWGEKGEAAEKSTRQPGRKAPKAPPPGEKVVLGRLRRAYFSRLLDD